VLDDDCYVEGDALRRAIAAAGSTDADLVSFTVDSSEPGQVFTQFYETGLLLFWGCSVLISRRALQAVGGFDERLFIWAHEVEWTMRFLDAGLRHLHLPEVRSVHMKPLPGNSERMHTRNVRNFGYVIGKLMPWPDAAVSLTCLLVRATIFAIRYRGWAQGIPAVIAGFREGLRHRQPVSRPVARLYRQNFLEFASWIELWPRLRYALFTRGVPGTEFFAMYWKRRPRLYPRSAAALRLRR
jgi:GT2 family glycosyltransferase